MRTRLPSCWQDCPGSRIQWCQRLTLCIVCSNFVWRWKISCGATTNFDAKCPGLAGLPLYSMLPIVWILEIWMPREREFLTIWSEKKWWYKQQNRTYIGTLETFISLVKPFKFKLSFICEKLNQYRVSWWLFLIIPTKELLAIHNSEVALSKKSQLINSLHLTTLPFDRCGYTEISVLLNWES